MFSISRCRSLRTISAWKSLNQYYNCRADLYVTNRAYRRTDTQEDNRIDGSLAILRIDRSVRERFELIAKEWQSERNKFFRKYLDLEKFVVILISRRRNRNEGLVIVIYDRVYLFRFIVFSSSETNARTLCSVCDTLKRKERKTRNQRRTRSTSTLDKYETIFIILFEIVRF